MDEIKILDERQKCRDKVSIWFGSKDNYMHPLKEIIANSVDEIYNNFDNGEIIITLYDDNKTITVEDSGRGIQIYGETNGIPNYELLLLKLFAGTNYENEINGKVTTGTNGVGLAVTNYCSKLFYISSYTKDKKYNIAFMNGAETICGLFEEKNKKNKHGTIIEFALDDEVFTNTIYDKDVIVNHLDNLSGVISSLNKDIKIKFIHMVNKDCGKEQIFKYKNFLEYFKTTCKDGVENIYECQELSYKNDGVNSIKCIFGTSFNPAHKTFLNTTYLTENGSIFNGIVYGLKDYLNKYFKNQNKIKSKADEIGVNDITSSVSFVCSIMSSSAEFSNQTKLSTNKYAYYKIARKYIMNLLEEFKNSKPSIFNKFAAHVLSVKKHNDKIFESHEQFKKKILEKNPNNIFNKIDGFVDCKKHGKDSEIFIAEGKSALGSIVTSRNPLNQSAIAIRGKILNCLKADTSEILNNETIINLVKALGCGVKFKDNTNKLDNFNIDKLKYGKIILLCDADEDGKQIICLLLAMFYVLMPDLLKEEKIYIALTPLFEIYDIKNKKYFYANSVEEKESIVKTLKSYKINRNKGLGEMNADVMARTGVNPETRNILKVKYKNAEKIDKIFNDWLGLEGSTRKQYIINNLEM